MNAIICAIIKDEHLYIEEWIKYHLNLGFTHIWLYEDYGSKSHKDLLNIYNEVTLVSLDETKLVPNKKVREGAQTQHSLYNYFLNKAKKEKLADWIAFIDIDEFIEFDKDYNLNKLMEDYKDYPGLYIPWVIYGANSHIKRPKGNVVDNYTSHLPFGVCVDCSLYWQQKSMANVHKAKSMASLHHVENGVNSKFECNTKNLCFEKVRLNHYITKSWEDYVHRMSKRGNMGNDERNYDLFFICNPELADKELELLKEAVEKGCCDVMWVSKKHKIISGGNEHRLKELKNKYLNVN